MKNRSYYIYTGVEIGDMNAGSAASDAAPTVVNCAGLFDTEYSFVTNNKRGRLDYYLMYITSGELTVKMPDGPCRVGVGDAVVFPPNYAYRYEYDGEGEGLTYFWVHFTGSHAGFYLSQFGFDTLPSVRACHRPERISEGFREMFGIFTSGERGYEHSLSAPLLKILSSLSGIEKEKYQISKSLAYINAHYTEDLKIPDLAAMENLCHSRYGAVFNAVTGMAPKRYMLSLRIRDACELLSTTDLSVKQIGITVGYPESHFFCKVFGIYMGCSPAEYRKKFKKHRKE